MSCQLTDTLDDLNAVNEALEKVRNVVHLARTTEGVSLETLCQQIDRIAGRWGEA